MTHITKVFEHALGARVSDFAKGGELGKREIEAVRDSYVDWWLRQPDSFTRAPNELWPLISHHEDVNGDVVLRDFVAGAGARRKKNPVNELHMHLVACNGVVLADPLRRIFFNVNGEPVSSPRGDQIHGVAARLADIEAFINEDIIHFSRTHPLLSDDARQAWITPFNLGQDLRVITDLIEEGYFPDPLQSDATVYQRKIEELLRVCGVDQYIPSTLTPLNKLMTFARALMEVSWQLAHATESDADLYLTNELERRIFEVLVEDCEDNLDVLMGSAHAGVHLEMLATVGLPLFDGSRVSADDIVDIRAGDAFTQWRSTLTTALDTYAIHTQTYDSARARTAFGNQLREAQHQLQATVKRHASLSKTFKKGTVGLGVGVTTTGMYQLVSDSHTMLTSSAIFALGLSVPLMYEYLTGRTSTDTKAHLRYFAAFDL